MPKSNIMPNVRMCNFCKSKVQFEAIAPSMSATLKKHSFPYKLSDFETLSYRSYKCPNCKSTDRDRLYKLYIDKFEDFDKKTQILDFAPSELLENYLRPMTQGYRTADLLVDKFDDKVDITDMKQYKDNTFDFIICSHVLEHVDDDQKAMSELFRVLKKGGKCILMTPIINKANVQDEDPSVSDISERIRRFAQDDHVRLYEKRVFLDRVRGAGFKIKAYGYRELGLREFIRNGIARKSKLYIVSKER